MVANRSRAMRDMLVKAIRKVPNLTVIAELSDEGSILGLEELEQADCVLVPLEQGRAPASLCKEILAKHPKMKVIAVTEAAEALALCWRSGEEVRCIYLKSSWKNILQAITCPPAPEGSNPGVCRGEAHRAGGSDQEKFTLEW